MAEEYVSTFIVFRPVFKNPKSIQASVVLLDRMALILDKSSDEDARELILPLLFHSLESNMTQIQAREIHDNISYLILFPQIMKLIPVQL